MTLRTAGKSAFMFTIIIILIVVLVIAAILVNAYQQHRAKVETERRSEIAKQKAVIEETESVLVACTHMPVSVRVITILNHRILSALQVLSELSNSSEIKQRLSDAQQQLQQQSNSDSSLTHNDFVLPENDKLIIQYIQAVKRLRTLLRAEHTKNKVDTKTFIEEDKALERLQLKVNVETLVRRGRAAMQSNMLGSARQYFEKAVAALENQTQQDDYIIQRSADLRELLHNIQENLKTANAEDRARKKSQENKDLDELFAPKRKW